MIYCAPEKCAVCQLIPGSDFCLRHQARRCIELSRRVFSGGVHDALEDIAHDLNEDAARIERSDRDTLAPP